MEGVNNYKMVADAIQKPDKNMLVSDIVYRMYTADYFKSWKSFSTTAYLPGGESADWKEFGSLENIHNHLHVSPPPICNLLLSLAYGAEMRRTRLEALIQVLELVLVTCVMCRWLHSTRSFTCITSKLPIIIFPIFLALNGLHSNVDRQLAIWQTLNGPTKWFDNPVVGTDPTPTDPLTPFHLQLASGEIRLYNSQDIQDWVPLGYDFDILAERSGEQRGTPQYVQRVLDDLGKAYAGRNTGDALLAADKSLLGRAPSSALMQQAPPPTPVPMALRSGDEAASDASAPQRTPELGEGEVFPDFLLNIIYDR